MTLALYGCPRCGDTGHDTYYCNVTQRRPECSHCCPDCLPVTVEAKEERDAAD